MTEDSLEQARQNLLQAQQKLMKLRWRFVFDEIYTRPWWDFWTHIHHHKMTFPEPNLEWVFVCECGHTTTNIEEAQP